MIGGIFILEISSSLAQLLSKRFLKRKLFPVAPFHIWLQYIGWPEPKIVQRAFLTGLVLTLFGLWIDLM